MNLAGSAESGRSRLSQHPFPSGIVESYEKGEGRAHSAVVRVPPLFPSLLLIHFCRARGARDPVKITVGVEENQDAVPATQVKMGKPMSAMVLHIGVIRRGGDENMDYQVGTHLCDWPLLLLLGLSLCNATAALASPRRSKPAHFHVSLPPGNLPAVCHLILGQHHILRPLRPHILRPEAHVRLPAELASFAASLGHAFIVHLHAARKRSYQSSTTSL
jgi:hypothetical protein